jgi:hypothetical protein
MQLERRWFGPINRLHSAKPCLSNALELTHLGLLLASSEDLDTDCSNLIDSGRRPSTAKSNAVNPN